MWLPERLSGHRCTGVNKVCDLSGRLTPAACDSGFLMCRQALGLAPTSQRNLPLISLEFTDVARVCCAFCELHHWPLHNPSAYPCLHAQKLLVALGWDWDLFSRWHSSRWPAYVPRRSSSHLPGTTRGCWYLPKETRNDGVAKKAEHHSWIHALLPGLPVPFSETALWSPASVSVKIERSSWVWPLGRVCHTQHLLFPPSLRMPVDMEGDSF